MRELIEEGELRFAPTRDVNFIRVPRSAIDEFLELHPSGRIDGCDGCDGSDGSDGS